MLNPVFLFAAFFSEILGTIGGFGSATLLTLFGIFFFPFKTTLVVVAFFHGAGALVRFFSFRKSVNWSTFLLFLFPDIVFVILGSFAISYISESSVRLLFGIFLLLYSFMGLFGLTFLVSQEKRPLFLAGGGMLSGFLAGLLGTGGAARTVVLQMAGLSKEAYLGTSALLAVITDIVRITVYISLGIAGFVIHEMSSLSILIIVSMCAAYIGSKIAHTIPSKAFSYIVFTLLFIAGIHFVFL